MKRLELSYIFLESNKAFGINLILKTTQLQNFSQ